MEMRRDLRARMALALVLTRRRGGPVSGCTVDVGPGGMRVTTERPLSVDETLAFDLEVDCDQHVDGHCRVLRQQGLNCYALRFEAIGDADLELLTGVVARAA